MQIPVLVLAFDASVYMPRSEIDGSYGNPIFKFLTNCHTVFHGGCAIFYSGCNHFTFPVVVHRFQCLHIFTNTCCFIIIIFYNRYPNRCEVVSCGFDL